MRLLLKSAALAAGLFTAVPAFAQWYGPAAPNYGPAYGYGYAYGPDDGYAAPAPAAPGPDAYGPVGGPPVGRMYEGRSVAVDPGAASDQVAYCESQFRSYNPATGMYLGFDGQRHPCP